MYLALFLALAAGPLPGPPPRSTVAVELERLIAASRHPDLRWGNFQDVQPDLTVLYQQRAWQPLWFSGTGLTSPARALLRVLSEAANRGLDPADYDVAWIESHANSPEAGSPELEARLELALSIAAARFATGLRRGRVPARLVHATYRADPDSFELGATVAALSGSTRPNALLQRLEPPFLHYWLLMSALGRYHQLARDSSLLVLAPGPRRLRPGEPYAGVPTLRRLLRLLGDYRDSASTPIIDTLYAGELVEAVKRFQIRQGFLPDGVIGDSTRGRMEHPFDQRIRQMELALERWRWMPRRFQHPPIIVNIPAFRLYAFGSLDLSEKEMLAMNVVVGTAFKSETPVFLDNLEYLIFSPYWDVTPTIAVNEIKPVALQDPEFLTRNRYELVEGWDPVAPWPENIERIGQGVRVRQTPGPHNALGAVKFIMPNDHQIYLHDTPSKSLFERTRRDASHGCIRLSDPLGLAKFLLRDQLDWTDDRIRAAADAGEPTTVRLRHPVPVLITYATAVARQNGDVFFYQDIYGHDRTLDRLLRKGYPYSR